MNRRILLFSLFSSVIMYSCNKDVIYRRAIPIPDNIWDMNKPLVFDVPVNDSIGKYDIYITVRNEDNYEFNNLFLFIDIKTPMKFTERDTLECPLADPNGRWMGKGLGDIWDNKFLFKRNMTFQRKGVYEFVFTQAMRVDSLPMIMDAGLSIEKAKINTRQ